MKKLHNALIFHESIASLMLTACEGKRYAQADNLLDAINQQGYILVFN